MLRKPIQLNNESKQKCQNDSSWAVEVSYIITFLISWKMITVDYCPVFFFLWLTSAALSQYFPFLYWQASYCCWDFLLRGQDCCSNSGYGYSGQDVFQGDYFQVLSCPCFLKPEPMQWVNHCLSGFFQLSSLVHSPKHRMHPAVKTKR